MILRDLYKKSHKQVTVASHMTVAAMAAQASPGMQRHEYSTYFVAQSLDELRNNISLGRDSLPLQTASRS
jgi:hypothetical protein